LPAKALFAKSNLLAKAYIYIYIVHTHLAGIKFYRYGARRRASGVCPL